MWNNISFCCVIYAAASSFPIKGLHNVKKDHFVVTDNIIIKKHQNRNIITKWNNLIVHCNPDLQNPYTARNRPKSKPFFGNLHLHPSSESSDCKPAKPTLTDALVINSNKCRFKQQVLRQDNRTLIGSRLLSSLIVTCRVSGWGVCLNDASTCAPSRVNWARGSGK